MVSTGANVKETQEFMRHSDPKLTMNVYAKLQPGQMAAAIDHLPDLSLENLDIVSKTGTDDATPKNLRSVCLQPGPQKNTMIHNGLVAQDNEQNNGFSGPESGPTSTHDPLVVGSNPTGPSLVISGQPSIYA